MRERLRIGEAADLLGVTPKTVRHYEKIGLLEEPERSESGYRLYDASDLLRLHRIKKLRSIGLSLRQVRSVLGGEDGTTVLRSVLEVLRAEVNGQIGRLEERRDRIEGMLARDDLEAVEPSPTFEKVMEMYGDRLSGVSASALEQERKLWTTLDAFDWPEGYGEENEELFRYFVERPEEHRAIMSLGQRLSELEEAPEDDPRVEVVARDLLRHFEEYPMPEGHTEGSMWSNETPIGEAMFGLMMSGFSPAQRRVMALVEEYVAQQDEDGRPDA
jgi:DNA-binding transcriptional MerR regulator